MSEAESRSGTEDEINKKVIVDSNEKLREEFEWTISEGGSAEVDQCVSSLSKSDGNSSTCSEALAAATPAKSHLLSTEYAVAIVESVASIPVPAQKCTENASGSLKSISNPLQSSPISSSNNNSAKNESSPPIEVSQPQSVTANQKNQITFDKSDSEVDEETKKSQSQSNKKSQEIKNSSKRKNIRLPDIKNPKAHHTSRKESGIPVGIAVAWQRLVTSAASLSTQTTSNVTTMSANTLPVSSPTKSTTAVANKCKVPQRPSSASPILPKSSKDDKRSFKTHSCNDHNTNKQSGANLTTASRPLPSSSVPPSSVSLLSNHLGNYLDHQFPYADGNPYSTNSHLHGHHGHYADWQSNLMVPHFSQGYNAAAVYMQQQQQQQLTLQQQLHMNSQPFSYPVTSYMYSGYPPESLHQFEQFIHQQQQSDLLRHHHQQQQQLLLRQQAEYDLQRPTPIPSPSPRLSIPVASPSPTTTGILNSPSSLSLSNHPAGATTPLPTNWSDLYHHHSSAALSPKSLTSSTPSPVTVHDFNLGFNITLSRKCATPNSLSPANITAINNNRSSICGSPKNFPFSSPFSPSLFPSKDVWKDVKISPVSLKRKKYSAMTDSIKDNQESGEMRSVEKGNDGCVREEKTYLNNGISSNSGKVSKFCVNEQDEGIVVVKVEPRESDVDNDIEELGVKGSDVNAEDLDNIGTSPSNPRDDSSFEAKESLQEPRLKISKKHDFKRLESLIEKRADESVYLLTQSHSSEDSEEVHSNTAKKAKLEFCAEHEKGGRVCCKHKSKSKLFETEKENQRFSDGMAVSVDLGKLDVQIKQERVEESEKYNDICQNSETFSKPHVCAIKQENNMFSITNVSLDHVEMQNLNPEATKGSLTLENGILGVCESRKQAATDNIHFTTSNNGTANRNTSVDCQPKLEAIEESEFSKTDSLEVCNELKTHDDCDFNYVDGVENDRKKVVPESNLPFSSSCKENNRSLDVSSNNSKPINANDSRVLDSIDTKQNESSKIVNVPVGDDRTCKKTFENYETKYFDSHNQASIDDATSKSDVEEDDTISSVAGIAVKVIGEREDAQLCITNPIVYSNSNGNATLSEDSDDREVIIRIKDDKSYLEDEAEESDSASYVNNQYTMNNSSSRNNNDISMYSSQTQPYAVNVNSNVSGRSSSSSILNNNNNMTSESDVDNLTTKIPCTPSGQRTHANQYSFNKTQTRAESIYQNGITPEDYSLNHNLISRKKSEETTLSPSPDAPQVSPSDPPVTLYLSPRTLPVRIISPQNIKIPTYTPVSGAHVESEGDTKYTTVVYQTMPEHLGLFSHENSLASPPSCDKDISSGDDTLQLRQQRILPNENQPTMQIRRNSFYISPETCIKPEDNHLDLLATVAQEFGRSDLGKVSNCLSVSSSGSCLSSPTSLQSIANTISTSDSIYCGTGDVLQPVPGVTNVFQEATIPTPNKSATDMFEFRCEDEDAFLKTKPLETKGYISSLTKKCQNVNLNQNQNTNPTYQPVLLKIPHIVPKAAASAAEKLKKAKLRQEKAKERNAEKRKSLSKKGLLNIPGASELSLCVKVKSNICNQTVSTERKPAADIPLSKLNEKIKIPYVAIQHKLEVDNKKISNDNTSANEQDAPKLPKVKQSKKEKSLTVEGNVTVKKKSKKKAVNAETEIENQQTSELQPLKPKKKKKKQLDTVNTAQLDTVIEESKGNVTNEKQALRKQKRTVILSKDGDKDKTNHLAKSEGVVESHVHPKEEGLNTSVKKSLNNSDLNYSNAEDKAKPKSSSTKRHKTSINHTNNSNKTITTKDTFTKKTMKNSSSKFKAVDLDSSLNSNLPHRQSPLKPIPVLPPSSNIEFEMSKERINMLSDRDRDHEHENENQFDWEANPTYAVTAIKLNTDKVSCESTDLSICTDKAEKKDKRKSSKPSKLSLLNLHNQTQRESSEREKVLKVKSQLKSFVHFAPRRIKIGHSQSTIPNRRHSSSSTSSRHIKPCLKAQPIVRPMSDKEDTDDSEFDLEVATLTRSISSSALNANNATQALRSNNSIKKKTQQQSKDRMTSVFSRKIETEDADKSREHSTNTSTAASATESCRLSLDSAISPEKPIKSEKRGRRASSASVSSPSKPTVNEKVVIENAAEMLDEMRILTEIQGLFYTGKLNALQPPDVYGVTLDNERGAPPHIIFSAEEVLEKCIREVKPCQLKTGLRICAYWSPQYSGLYPGKVSLDYNPNSETDLIPIEFDDGDTGVIKVGEIRLLAINHPIREYDPNPLLTLEKKHRKRRASSTNGGSGVCTGDHEDADCGEPYCAKLAKFEEEEKEEHRSTKLLYWTWTGLGYKIPKTKKYRHKEFFRGIQRGDEIINVGDSALFISNGNDRPFIGRIERFWEKKGRKIVNVKWFYHPEEVETGKRLHGMKYAGALFESPHIDENDVQTIAKKCEVLPFKEFKERIGGLPKLSKNASPKDIYYIAGYYNPYTFKLKINDLK